MVYKKFYISIILRAILLAVNALALAYYWWIPGMLHLKFTLGVIFVIQVIILIWFLNRINRKLSSFFQSVKSDDYTIVYADAGKKGDFAELNHQLDKLTQYFKKLKLENEQRNLYFKAVIEHVATGIFAFSPSGRIHFINSAALDMFGVSYLKNINSLGNIQHGLAGFFKNLKPGNPRLLELKTDKQVLELSARPTLYKTPDEEWMLVSLQNIRSELEQKETQTWQKMIRILTHEIMNSISPITSLAASLSKLVGNKESTDKYHTDKTNFKLKKGLSVIKSRGDGLVEFVEKYRELSILPQPQLEELIIADVCRSIEVLFEHQLQQGSIKFLYNCKPETLVQFADRKMLEQVIINLVKNAILALQDAVKKEIEISAEKSAAGGIIIRISDTGCGIDPENLDKIFIPFFTTNSKGGSGIGLSLSRQIMMMHGGSIRLESSKPGKTIFRLDFVK